jgi:hypothetical protein
MNPDGHGFAAYCRVTPPHPGKGNAEKLKPNPGPPPLPISAFAPVVSSFQLPFLGSLVEHFLNLAPDVAKRSADQYTSMASTTRRKFVSPWA